VLDAIEEPLNVIAVGIQMWAEANRFSAISFRRDVCPGSTLTSKIPDRIGVVGSVGQQHSVAAMLSQHFTGE
jgi:hypothetical protein